MRLWGHSMEVSVVDGAITLMKSVELNTDAFISKVELFMDPKPGPLDFAAVELRVRADLHLAEHFSGSECIHSEIRPGGAVVSPSSPIAKDRLQVEVVFDPERYDSDRLEREAVTPESSAMYRPPSMSGIAGLRLKGQALADELCVVLHTYVRNES